MPDRFAILLDGGFVRNKLGELKRAELIAAGGDPQKDYPLEEVFPSADDVVKLADRIKHHSRLVASELFRIYYYDSPPMGGSKKNPISGRKYDFEGNKVHGLNQRLQDTLAQTSDVAVRRGETVFRGWYLRDFALEEIAKTQRPLKGEDLAPDIQQKGVDLRIGLDVALISIKRIVDTIVLVSGDADLVPAMKFARREGLRVYLDTMGGKVRSNLTEHSDYHFNSSPLPPPPTPPAPPTPAA